MGNLLIETRGGNRSGAAPGHRPAPPRSAGFGLALLTAPVLLATLLLLPALLIGLLLTGLLTGLLGRTLPLSALLAALLRVLIELNRLAALGVLVFLELVGHDLRPSLL
jgi:hypothetical protein